MNFEAWMLTTTCTIKLSQIMKHLAEQLTWTFSINQTTSDLGNITWILVHEHLASRWNTCSWFQQCHSTHQAQLLSETNVSVYFINTTAVYEVGGKPNKKSIKQYHKRVIIQLPNCDNEVSLRRSYRFNYLPTWKKTTWHWSVNSHEKLLKKKKKAIKRQQIGSEQFWALSKEFSVANK